MERISDEELAAALAEAFDQDGVDRRLQKATAKMSPQDIEISERNIRRWISAAKHSRGNDSEDSRAM